MAQAVRILGMKGATARKLRHLDIAYAYARHITSAKASQLLADLDAELEARTDIDTELVAQQEATNEAAAPLIAGALSDGSTDAHPLNEKLDQIVAGVWLLLDKDTNTETQLASRITHLQVQPAAAIADSFFACDLAANDFTDTAVQTDNDMTKQLQHDDVNVDKNSIAVQTEDPLPSAAAAAPSEALLAELAQLRETIARLESERDEAAASAMAFFSQLRELRQQQQELRSQVLEMAGQLNEMNARLQAQHFAG